MAIPGELPEDDADRAVAQWQLQRPDLDFTAMGPLARLARLAMDGGRLVDRVFEDQQLDRVDFNILAALRRKGSPFRLRPSELADALLTARGTITKHIDRLETAGLVERIANESDRRSLDIGLTPAGLTCIDDLVVTHVQNEARLLTVLSPAELATFDRTLRTLLRAIGHGA